MQGVIHDLTTSFTNELSNKELSLRDAQLQLREVTSELTDLRTKIADMQQAIESAEYYGERVKRLHLILEQEALKDARFVTVSEPMSVQFAVASVEAGQQILKDSLLELDSVARSFVKTGSTPPTSELLCKKIISQCLSVPFDEIDKLLDPLAQAVATDGNASDLNLGELNRFMSRVRGREPESSTVTA